MLWIRFSVVSKREWEAFHCLRQAILDFHLLRHITLIGKMLADLIHRVMNEFDDFAVLEESARCIVAAQRGCEVIASFVGHISTVSSNRIAVDRQKY